jgi:hypothetical protein
MKIRIRQYQFEVSEPFAGGQEITRADRQALDRLRAENIRNNVVKVVEEVTALLAPGQLLSQDALGELQRRIDRYDQGYKFLERHEPRGKPGLIEAEIRRVAEERCEAQFRGVHATEEMRQARLVTLERDDGVVEEARRRVEEQARVAAESLDGLFQP